MVNRPVLAPLARKEGILHSCGVIKSPAVSESRNKRVKLTFRGRFFQLSEDLCLLVDGQLEAVEKRERVRERRRGFSQKQQARKAGHGQCFTVPTVCLRAFSFLLQCGTRALLLWGYFAMEKNKLTNPFVLNTQKDPKWQ